MSHWHMHVPSPHHFAWFTMHWVPWEVRWRGKSPTGHSHIITLQAPGGHVGCAGTSDTSSPS